MFERYTENARRAIFSARYEASEVGSPYIEVEHILLGLMREDRRFFEELLSGKVSLGDLVEEIRSGLTKNPKISTSVDLPLSHASKRVLAYGAEEAEMLTSRMIGTPHLLLGVLREGTPAAATFEKFGINLHRLRSEEQKSGAADKQSPAAMKTLRENFASLLERLTPEVEPAIVFCLQASSKEAPQ